MRKTLIKCQNIKNPFYVENYSHLRALTDDKDWSYNWLKTLKMPFDYEGFRISRMQNQNCPSGQKWGEEKEITENSTTDD